MKNNRITDAWWEKVVYEQPLMKIMQLQNGDILTTSGNKDENQGEWDAQYLIVQEGGFIE